MCRNHNFLDYCPNWFHLWIISVLFLILSFFASPSILLRNLISLALILLLYLSVEVKDLISQHFCSLLLLCSSVFPCISHCHHTILLTRIIIIISLSSCFLLCVFKFWLSKDLIDAKLIYYYSLWSLPLLIFNLPLLSWYYPLYPLSVPVWFY